MHLRRLIWLLLVLASCSSRETALSPAEYYDLGRYARLDEDWEGAIGYFEKSLSAAERAGNDYYRGYACQQLSALWTIASEYRKALDYARSAASALDACGETAGALLSRLDMAWCHLQLGDLELARALLPGTLSLLDSPQAARLNHLASALGFPLEELVPAH
jgi:tetratricopeptide (TPR) repeat protein